jgi:hypothetical protein
MVAFCLPLSVNEFDKMVNARYKGVTTMARMITPFYALVNMGFSKICKKLILF